MKFNRGTLNQPWELRKKYDVIYFDFCCHKGQIQQGQIQQHYNGKNFR